MPPVPPTIITALKRKFPKPQIDHAWLQACYDWVIEEFPDVNPTRVDQVVGLAARHLCRASPPINWGKDIDLSNAWIQSESIFTLINDGQDIWVFDIPPMGPASESIPVTDAPTILRWSVPTSEIEHRYSNHNTAGAWKPIEHHIQQVRLHLRMHSVYSDTFILVASPPTKDQLYGWNLLHDGPFPHHTKSRVHQLASGLVVTISTRPTHTHIGAAFQIVAYPSIPYRVESVLQTDVAINRYHEASLETSPCTVSGTFIIKEHWKDAEAREWSFWHSLLTFD